MVQTKIKKRGKVMKKKLALAVLLAFMVSLSACGNTDTAQDQTDAAEDPGTPVYTKVLEVENFNRILVTGGLLQAESTVYVMPKISGMEEIKNVYVKVGDKVSAGQTLASLDQESTMLQYDSTKLQYDEMMKNLNNTKTLYEAGAVSRNDYESLEAQAKALEIQLRGLQMSLDNLEITAPIAGTIVSVSAEGRQLCYCLAADVYDFRYRYFGGRSRGKRDQRKQNCRRRCGKHHDSDIG